MDIYPNQCTSIPVIEDEATIAYIKELRDKFKAGEITDWGLVQAGAVLYRETTVYDTKTLVTHTHIVTKTSGPEIEPVDIDFEKMYVGPLVTPKVKDELRFIFQDIAINEKIKLLSERETLLNEKIRLMDGLLKRK